MAKSIDGAEGFGQPRPKRPTSHKKKIGEGSVRISKTPANTGLAEDDPGYVPYVRPSNQSFGEWKLHGTPVSGPYAAWHEAGVPGNATHSTPQQNLEDADFETVFGRIGRGVTAGASASEGRARNNRRNRK